MSEAPQARIPVTILTGFLGSGKTTLLNRLLASPAGRRLAVIVNEFGEIGIDGALVAGGSRFVELDNGCLCCAVNADLEKTIRELQERGGFDQVVLETTGLADPVPIAWTFARSGMGDFYRIDAVVTLIDCANVGAVVDKHIEAREQIMGSDIVVLNKLDLVADAGAAAETIVRGLNRLAPIVRSGGARAAWELIVAGEGAESLVFADARADHAHGRHSHFDSYAAELPGRFSETDLEDFAYDLPDAVYRFKALVRLENDDPWPWAVVNAVAGRVDIGPCTPRQPLDKSRFVFIGPDLDHQALAAACQRLAQAAH